MSNSGKPGGGYRTFVLVLLTLVYGFNFIDRQIVGILAPFIQADLELSDTQIGLLIGLAFAFIYTVIAALCTYFSFSDCEYDLALEDTTFL